MHRCFRFAALLLLALWLPATLHCDLEAAGIAPAAIACPGEHAPDDHTADNCALVENGAFKATFLLLKAPIPALHACDFSCLAALPPPPAFVPLLAPERTDTPPELTRTWQFLARAAAPARAPGLNA